MFFILIPIAVISAIGAVASIAIRRVDVDSSKWHVDPTTAPPTGNPNWYRLTPDSAPADRDPTRDGSAPEFDADVAELAAAFDGVALADDRVEVVAGSAADGFVTYVQRSKLFAFPDFISVKFVELPGGGSSLSIYSRAQYGKSDFDVNEKRVVRWVDATKQRLS